MLDFKKPHGQIWGHPWATYEQDGVLYDAAGREKDDIGCKVDPDLKPEFDDPEEFLQHCLEGGPKVRDVVYKEAQEASLIWASVETVAAEMGIRKYKSGIKDMWQLN